MDTTQHSAEAGVDEPTEVAPRRRIPWNAVAGVVVLVYVVVWAATLTNISDRNTFDRWGAAMGSLGARAAISIVVLATLFHTFDGMRRAALAARPALAARDERLRAAVLFLTWAVALPSIVVIIWPWISETMR
jgi:hypothetical protein